MPPSVPPKNLRQTTLPWARTPSSSSSQPTSSTPHRPRRTPAEPTTSSSSPARAPPSLPNQHTFTTPSWCREVRTLSTISNAAKPTTAQYQSTEALVAAETISLTPFILASSSATPESHLYHDPPPPSISTKWVLAKRHRPSFPSPAKVKVTGEDTLDCALRLLAAPGAAGVCVLNMANASLQGGGFLEGARAQEEMLCYRSTLVRTLKMEWYPWPDVAVVYSPRVCVFRAGVEAGYRELEEGRRKCVAVVSCAAVRCYGEVEERYEFEWQREWMKAKMRLVLRVCGRRGERRLVLGALGCGAFRNPVREVAECWREVLEEEEVRGWWREVVFAVWCPEGAGERERENFEVFREVLEGLEV